jgi:hypothetical protein
VNLRCNNSPQQNEAHEVQTPIVKSNSAPLTKTKHINVHLSPTLKQILFQSQLSPKIPILYQLPTPPRGLPSSVAPSHPSTPSRENHRHTNHRQSSNISRRHFSSRIHIQTRTYKLVIVSGHTALTNVPRCTRTASPRVKHCLHLRRTTEEHFRCERHRR